LGLTTTLYEREYVSIVLTPMVFVVMFDLVRIAANFFILYIFHKVIINHLLLEM